MMKGTSMFTIFVGSEETMTACANHGVRALNPKTMRWQIVDKNVKYQVRIDKAIEDEYSPTGFCNMATLLCDKDLKAIARGKGLLLG